MGQYSLANPYGAPHSRGALGQHCRGTALPGYGAAIVGWVRVRLTCPCVLCCSSVHQAPPKQAVGTGGGAGMSPCGPTCRPVGTPFMAPSTCTPTRPLPSRPPRPPRSCPVPHQALLEGAWTRSLYTGGGVEGRGPAVFMVHHARWAMQGVRVGCIHACGVRCLSKVPGWQGACWGSLGGVAAGCRLGSHASQGHHSWVCYSWVCYSWVCYSWVCYSWACYSWACYSWVCYSWL